MKYEIEFEIAGLPKTINQIGRHHWTAKAKEAKKWKNAVIMATLGKRPTEPLIKARCTFTRCSSFCPDSDGLVSSFKHVCDGLIEAGVIVGDTFKVIGMPEFKWEKAPREYGKIKVKVISAE